MNNNKQVLYWEYLKLDKLPSLQSGIDGNADVQNNDELHFIIVHQVYELWFKLLLNELTLIRDKMNTNYRIFRELWAVRTIVLNRELLVDLNHPYKYGFFSEQ